MTGRPGAVGDVSGCRAGLEAAHAAGLVHGDLHAEIVLVASDGTPKIAEAGLFAAACAAAADLWPRHRSAGSDRSLDAAADRRALAALLARLDAAPVALTQQLAQDPPATARVAIEPVPEGGVDSPGNVGGAIPRIRRPRPRHQPFGSTWKVAAPLPLVVVLTAVLLLVAFTDVDAPSVVPERDAPAQSDLPPQVPR